MLYYPIAISKDDDMQNYASVVPDVNGCFGFGDTIDETIESTKELLQEHIATMLELDMPFEFKVSSVESLQANTEYKDVIWAVVSIDETAFDRHVRFNVSWSEHLLKRVDEYISKTHDTRSGFLAKLAQDKLSV